ncbi:hypothetical protein [Amphritea sp.]|uniref:hypothetical protein n=1 Tax=Amphritea sp. TaxID=1872502 RepID=UPI003D0D03C3
MKRMIFMISVILCGQVFADELKQFDFKVPPKSIQSRATVSECKFEDLTIPENTVVYAAGGYSGKNAGFQIDQSGHAATQFDIAVNSQDRPVILMLGAYEPTIWNLGWSEGTQILAVLVSGYHRQAVAGLKSDTPVLNSSYDNKGPCGYFYIGKGNNSSLNPKSRKLFGKSVELVYLGDRSGKIVVGAPLSGTERLMTSAKSTPDSFRDTTAPLAGQAGLDDAVAKGLIRPATSADADQWVEEVAANTSNQDVPPIAGQGMPKPPRPDLYNAFVVLKNFTYPSGLFGGNAATFFIPRGVPAPQGNPGHSAVYDFSALRCRGAQCRR